MGDMDRFCHACGAPAVYPETPSDRAGSAETNEEIIFNPPYESPSNNTKRELQFADEKSSGSDSAEGNGRDGFAGGDMEEAWKSVRKEEGATGTKETGKKRPLTESEFVWNVYEFPKGPRKTEEINFNWNLDDYSNQKEKEKEAQTLEEVLFKEIEDDARRFREKNLDRFFTFSRKNEEFQQLLDREYERIRSRSGLKNGPTRIEPSETETEKEKEKEKEKVPEAPGLVQDGLQAEAGSQTEAGLQSEAGPHLEFPVQAEAEPQLDAVPQAEPASEFKTLPEFETGFKPEPATEPEAAYAPEAEPKSEAEPEPKAAPESEAAPELEAESSPEADLDLGDLFGQAYEKPGAEPAKETAASEETATVEETAADGESAADDELAAADERSAFQTEEPEKQEAEPAEESGESAEGILEDQPAGEPESLSKLLTFTRDKHEVSDDLEARIQEVFSAIEQESEPKQKRSVWTILLIVVAVILAIEIVILGIRYFAPESAAASAINKAQANVVLTISGWVDGIKGLFSGQDSDEGTTTPGGDGEDGDGPTAGAGGNEPGEGESGTGSGKEVPDPNPAADKNALIAAQLGNNVNIQQVRANDALAWQQGKDYGIEDLNNSKPITNNIWKLPENGEPVYYDRSIVGTIIAFDSQWIDYVNSGNKSVLDLLKKDSAAYKKVTNFSGVGKIKETFKLLEIGEIRQGAAGFYVWTHEEIQVTEGGKTRDKKYNWIYYLEPAEGKMKIVDYYRY